jgi:hypothetical protein
MQEKDPLPIRLFFHCPLFRCFFSLLMEISLAVDENYTRFDLSNYFNNQIEIIK